VVTPVLSVGLIAFIFATVFITVGMDSLPFRGFMDEVLIVINPFTTMGLVVFVDVRSITTVPFIEAFLGVFVAINSCLVLPPLTCVELVPVDKFVEVWFFMGLVNFVIT